MESFGIWLAIPVGWLALAFLVLPLVKGAPGTKAAKGRKSKVRF